MKAIPARNTTLVVIEFGGSWPRWLEPARIGHMAVVAQHYEGEPGSLITQVASRVTRLESVGWAVRSIVFVSNGRHSAEARAARSVLVRGLVARLEHTADTLVLTANAPLGSRPCRELNALAAAIGNEFRSPHPPAISVRADRGTDICESTEAALKAIA